MIGRSRSPVFEKPLDQMGWIGPLDNPSKNPLSSGRRICHVAWAVRLGYAVWLGCINLSPRVSALLLNRRLDDALRQWPWVMSIQAILRGGANDQSAALARLRHDLSAGVSCCCPNHHDVAQCCCSRSWVRLEYLDGPIDAQRLLQRRSIWSSCTARCSLATPTSSMSHTGAA